MERIALSPSTHMINMADFVAIGVETLKDRWWVLFEEIVH